MHWAIDCVQLIYAFYRLARNASYINYFFIEKQTERFCWSI